MNTIDDAEGLGLLLRERVHGVRPDLDRLAVTSRRAGTRIRRRRALGASALVVAGVATLGTAGWALTPGQAPTIDSDQDVAGASTSPPRSAPTTTTSCATAPRPMEQPEAVGPDGDSVELGEGRMPTSESLPVCKDTISAGPTPPAIAPQQLPVRPKRHPTVGDAGYDWAFGRAGDDKFSATRLGVSVTVHIRPLDEYAAYSGGDTDKQAVWVSRQYSNYFATIEGELDPHSALVSDLVAALHFDKTFQEWLHHSPK